MQAAESGPVPEQMDTGGDKGQTAGDLQGRFQHSFRKFSIPKDAQHLL